MADDLRATIQEAMNAAETESPPASPATADTGSEAPGAAGGASPQAGTSEPAVDSAAGVHGRNRDASGKFAAKDKETTAPKVAGAQKQGGPEPHAAPTSTDVASPTPSVGAVPSPDPTTPELRPPSTWKPAAREKWAALPPDIRAEVTRREYEVQRALNEGAPAKKFHAEFNQAVAPFEPMFRQAGVNPIQAAQSAFGTIQQLQQGSPESRAKVFADLMRAYPTSVEALAGFIDGQGPSMNNARQEAYADPKVIAAQVRQELTQSFQQQRQERETVKARAAVEEFAANPEHEFFEDVWADMAGLIDSAKARGVEMDMKEAYTRSVWANPEIRAIVQQREQAKSAATSEAATQRASAAGSSVRNHPATAINGARPGDLRSDIMASIAKLNGGR